MNNIYQNVSSYPSVPYQENDVNLSVPLGTNYDKRLQATGFGLLAPDFGLQANIYLCHLMPDA